MFSKVLSIAKPSVAALGFAMFIVINAAGLWGGIVSFVPSDVEGKGLSSLFYLGHTVLFLLYCIVWIGGSYGFRLFSRVPSVGCGVVPYAAGWCMLAASPYAGQICFPVAMVGGALYLFGDVLMLLLWQRVFASEDADRGNRGLIIASIYASAVYLCVYLVPGAGAMLTVALVCLPLCCACLVFASYRINFKQPMFEDVPKEHSLLYAHMARNILYGACIVGTMGFCSGSVRPVFLGEQLAVDFLNIASAVLTLAIMAALLLCWQFKSIRFSITTAYRFFFPFLATGLLLMPFLPQGLLSVAAGVIHAFFSCGIIVMAIISARISRDQGVNPIFAFAVYCAVAYTMRNMGIVTGSLAVEQNGFGIGPVPFVVIVSFYAIGITYFFWRGGFARTPRVLGEIVDVELLSLDTFGKKKSGSVRRPDSADALQQKDRIDVQCEKMQDVYRLSLREAEVMGLVARGNSVPGIAEKLFISESTVQTHMRHIYSKLGVHKKQDAIDLLEKL